MNNPFTGGTRVDVGGVSVSTEHYIGGKRVASPTTFEDRSPLDWSVKLADVARGDAATAELAVGAAVDAFPAWAALGPDGRAEILRRLADLIDENIESLAAVECLDMAMLHESLRLRVLSRGARNFRAYADLATQYEERVWESNGTTNRVMRMPAGPTVVITPWNAPFMLSTWKCAPALAAGNTVVLKPAEWSPLSCSLLADLSHAAGMPAGVFNVVQGIGAEVGAALVADTRVRRISFTGSPETGRHIGRAAATNLVPFTAELGGKGPFVVFADADLEAAAQKAAGQYDDSGQVCLAGTRLLVEASVRDEFLRLFDKFADQHVLGDSHDAATTISPMIHPTHFARVAGFVDRALENGDTILRGGRPSELGGDDGLWYEPTLIAPKSNDSEIVQREVFGPVLTFQTFTDEADAIRLANSTPYGLSAIVYTSSQERAERMGRAIRAGTIWTNCFLVRDLTAPFGGIGISGMGREGGDYALDFCSDLKTFQVKEGTTGRAAPTP
ncbi:MAG: aldehyde dehydrogenase [Ilumatobacteraceae bacterium]